MTPATAERLIATRARVEWCGEECGCTLPLVEEVYWTASGEEHIVRVWTGTRRTAHEEGADAELEAYRASLAPEAASRIVWPS